MKWCVKNLKKKKQSIIRHFATQLADDERKTYVVGKFFRPEIYFACMRRGARVIDGNEIPFTCTTIAFCDRKINIFAIRQRRAWFLRMRHEAATIHALRMRNENNQMRVSRVFCRVTPRNTNPGGAGGGNYNAYNTRHLTSFAV